jgi:hypothetical protein
MVRHLSVPSTPARSVPGRPIPTGIAVAMGVTAMVVSALVAAAVPASAGAVRLGLVAVTLAGFAALTVDPNAIAAVGVMAFLIFDGFLVNQLGELSWHGAADERHLLVLAAAAVVGHVAGSAYRAVRRWRVWQQRSAWVAAQVRDAAWSFDEQPSREKAIVWNEKEIRRG